MAPRSQQWRASVDASRSRSGGRRCATRCVLRPYRQYPRGPYRRPQPVLVAPRATAGWLPEGDSSRPSAWSAVARCGVAAAPTDEDVAAATVQKAQEASRRPRPPRRSPSASSRPTQPRAVERGRPGRPARASDATWGARDVARVERGLGNDAMRVPRRRPPPKDNLRLGHHAIRDFALLAAADGQCRVDMGLDETG